MLIEVQSQNQSNSMQEGIYSEELTKAKHKTKEASKRVQTMKLNKE